jgi:hypothetical protein
VVAQSVMTGCYLGPGILLSVDRARSGAQTAAAEEIDRSGAPLPFAITVEPAPERRCRLRILATLHNLASPEIRRKSSPYVRNESWLGQSF